jgi:hypothetical protein
VRGHAAFRDAFGAGAPRTADGKSLRDFSLHGRIFAQRCSYLIYSEMFARLPEPLKVRIFARLRSALESRDPKDRYAYLPVEEKQAIRAILLETHPEAKTRWR